MEFLIPDFRSQSMQQLEQLTPEQVVPFETDDIAPNYTIVLRPEEKAIAVTASLISHIHEIDPGHYMYPLDQLHMTLIGNLSIEAAPEVIIDAVKKYITKDALQFVLFGLGSNGQSSSISAYPHNLGLAQLRAVLRTAVGTHGDDFTSSLPAYEKVCWMNYMRYKHKPKQELLDFIRSQKDTRYGQISIDSIQLIKNTSKILDPKKCELIYSV